MPWLAGMLMAKSDDLVYAIGLVRSKPQSMVLPPRVYSEIFIYNKKKVLSILKNKHKTWYPKYQNTTGSDNTLRSRIHQGY